MSWWGSIKINPFFSWRWRRLGKQQFARNVSYLGVDSARHPSRLSIYVSEGQFMYDCLMHLIVWPESLSRFFPPRASGRQNGGYLPFRNWQFEFGAAFLESNRYLFGSTQHNPRQLRKNLLVLPAPGAVVKPSTTARRTRVFDYLDGTEIKHEGCSTNFGLNLLFSAKFI